MYQNMLQIPKRAAFLALSLLFAGAISAQAPSLLCSSNPGACRPRS